MALRRRTSPALNVSPEQARAALSHPKDISGYDRATPKFNDLKLFRITCMGTLTPAKMASAVLIQMIEMAEPTGTKEASAVTVKPASKSPSSEMRLRVFAAFTFDLYGGVRDL